MYSDISIYRGILHISVVVVVVVLKAQHRILLGQLWQRHKYDFSPRFHYRIVSYRTHKLVYMRIRLLVTYVPWVIGIHLFMFMFIFVVPSLESLAPPMCCALPHPPSSSPRHRSWPPHGCCPTGCCPGPDPWVPNLPAACRHHFPPFHRDPSSCRPS